MFHGISKSENANLFAAAWGDLGGLRPSTPPGALPLDPVSDAAIRKTKQRADVTWGDLGGRCPSTPPGTLSLDPVSDAAIRKTKQRADVT